MSVYALNCCAGFAPAAELTMLSQYRGDEEGTRVYGGATAERRWRAGYRVEARRRADCGDFERDVRELADLIAASMRAHRSRPACAVRLSAGLASRGAAVLAAERRFGAGRRRDWVGSCCQTHRDAMRIVLDNANAVLIAGLVSRRGRRQAVHRSRTIHHVPAASTSSASRPVRTALQRRRDIHLPRTRRPPQRGAGPP